MIIFKQQQKNSQQLDKQQCGVNIDESFEIQYWIDRYKAWQG